MSGVLVGYKYRLVDQAVKYQFLHKPFEDKSAKQKYERDQQARHKNGLRDDPQYSAGRFINKIFDHNRSKARKLMQCQGCDLEYEWRDKVMGVGTYTRGALKNLSPEKAQETYRPLNIDRESKKEKTIANEIQKRHTPLSQYDCDNMYRNLSIPSRPTGNFSQMINYETTPMNKQLYGSACSTNYYYFDKLSMP